MCVDALRCKKSNRGMFLYIIKAQKAKLDAIDRNSDEAKELRKKMQEMLTKFKETAPKK